MTKPYPSARISGGSGPAPSLRRAFTLIELLIVVAIIAILAAIAIPNLLNAQVRAKVARVAADSRSLATAFEAYRVDNNEYPPRFGPETVNYAVDTFESLSLLPRWPAYSTRIKDSFDNLSMGLVTSPVAYISGLPLDIFDSAAFRTVEYPRLIDYADPDQTKLMLEGARLFNGAFPAAITKEGFVLVSVGPDGLFGHANSAALDFPMETGDTLRTFTKPYDPTNGTTSSGNIYRFSFTNDPWAALSADDF